MHSILSILLTVLPLLAASSPIALNTQTIALKRRSNFLISDGSVNVEGLRAQAARVAGNVQKGFAVFEQNTGRTHPSAKTTTHSKRAAGSVPLTDDSAKLWYGTISVGTPPKDFTVDFDTGSSDLFLPGPSCSTCTGHTVFDTSSSSTATDLGKTFTIAHDDLATSGEQYKDTVHIAGLAATDQTVGVASQYSPGLSVDHFPADGLLGMAFPSISVYPATPVFHTLVAQGQTTEPLFAFKLAASGSQLTVGGVDGSLYTGAITYTPVTVEGFWQVNVGGLAVNDQHAVDAFSGIIDSGTSLVIGPPEAVKQFYATIPGSKDASSIVGAGFWTVPCNAIPTVSLTFSDKSFAISPSIFNLGPVQQGSTDCVGGIMGKDIGANFWIIGDVFMQNVYTVFDVGQSRVGFATLA